MIEAREGSVMDFFMVKMWSRVGRACKKPFLFNNKG